MAKQSENRTINRHLEAAYDTVKKYKYPVFILIFGIFLMLLPKKAIPEETVHEMETVDALQEDLEQNLEQILQKIDGAGQTEVLLSVEFGRKSTYQTDEQRQTNTEYEQYEEQTVLISNHGGEDRPILITEQYPIYRGAVVVCEGADRPTVKFNLIRAVSSATGLSSDKISVMKMRQN